MKKQKRLADRLIIILLVTAAIILTVRHFHITDFHIIRPGVLYTSGQPRGMDYTRLLYKYHIATIVNIRSVFEHRETNWYNEEIMWTRNNGVNYIELPIARDNYFADEETQHQFLATMADKKNLPVLLHDSSGEKRVSMLVAVWLIKGDGLALNDTMKAVEEIREQPLSEAEKDFIRSLTR
jgi:protein tyrosine phosphatase (PTP) superfamily phosphohydrolase (DUF442 family)